MIKTKLVTFTPSDAFFFGGENTFGNGENRNFYAASNVFPQQTTLVGVMRHALFEAGHGNKIGQSFVVGQTPDFGDLKSISPVFISQNLPSSKGYALPVLLPNTADEPVPINLTIKDEKKFAVNFGETWQAAPEVAEYTEKNGLVARLLFTKGVKPLKVYKQVFQEITKTGIARNRKLHTTKTGMFYQQTLFKMKKGYAFATFVTGTDELFTALNHRNMPMGGEKMNFVLGVEETDTTFEKLFWQQFTEHCMAYEKDWVLLTSDAYVSPSIYQLCHLAISETKSFRNIITPNSQHLNLASLLSPSEDKESKAAYQHNLTLARAQKIRYKSEKMTLLKRGTVLFPKNNIAEVTEKLTDNNFRTIGYNHYFTNQTIL